MSDNQNNPKNMPESVTEKITWPAILITSVGLAVFLLAVIFASMLVVEGLVTADRNAKIGAGGTRELNALRAEDTKILSEYRALENGMYRIPIDLAMELTIKGAGTKVSGEPMSEEIPSDSLQIEAPMDSGAGSAADSNKEQGQH